MAKPVFYDPRQLRWRGLRRLFDVLAVTITLLVVFFIYTAIRDEQLPGLFLPAQKRPIHALKKEREKEKEKKKLANIRSRRKTKKPPSQVTLNADEGIRAAFYVQGDAASFSSLREYAHQIDMLYPEWLHVLGPEGNVQGLDQQTYHYFNVVHDGKVRTVDDEVMPFLKSEDTDMEVFPLVNNFDETEWKPEIARFLMDPAARANFRRQIDAFLASDKYRGLMVDFEDFAKNAQPGYLALLCELSQDLHAKGIKLYVSVPARDRDFDYAPIADRTDGVVLMDYDEHESENEPGPVASQDWFTKNLELAKQKIPLDKLICAIGNYGYDWVQKPKKNPPPNLKITNVTVQEAWISARDSDEDVDFDYDSLNPHFSYMDDNNLRHDVWFLDGVTALNEMRSARNLGIKTFALWRLGSEDRSMWKIWDLPSDPTAPDKLKDVQPGQDVDMEGQGEILRIEARPANGERDITVDPATGLITDQVFKNLPEPYRVARYGATAKQVAITFDDGPDPEWSPKILDVLKREHAPATFFLIGIQAENNPALTKRIYDEGHEIGNHTFTHPDISNISKSYMKVELNLTERLFASRLGIRTILFRPPYAIDQEPDTADQVRPLEITQDMGYITVGNRIDPNDWRDNPRRSAEEIRDAVMKDLPACNVNDQLCGNIILLHDGGGDRRETVRSLPMIIEGLRARGYQIVPVYQLLGKAKADVMPPIPKNERWAAWLNRIGFWLWGAGMLSITWIFFLGDLLMTSRLVLVGALSIYDLFSSHEGGPAAEGAAFKPRGAVLIPAYKEERVVERRVRSVLDSDYPNLHVIVIDDGSKDRTLEVARRAFAQEEAEGHVLILTKPNAGKAEALNYGLEHLTDEEIFIGIDGDTIIAT